MGDDLQLMPMWPFFAFFSVKHALQHFRVAHGPSQLVVTSVGILVVLLVRMAGKSLGRVWLMPGFWARYETTQGAGHLQRCAHTDSKAAGASPFSHALAWAGQCLHLFPVLWIVHYTCH